MRHFKKRLLKFSNLFYDLDNWTTSITKMLSFFRLIYNHYKKPHLLMVRFTVKRLNEVFYYMAFIETIKTGALL
jgi:hypothetical protein